MGESENQVEGEALTTSSPLDLAVERHRDGDLAEARRLYEEVLSADPTHGRGWYLLGVLHNQQNRSQEARACFEKSVWLSPLDHEAWFQLGRLHYSIKEYQLARGAFAESVLLQPTNFRYFNALGNAELNLERLNVAYKFYEIAHGLNPRDLSILNNLGNVSRLTKNLTVSEKYLSTAAQLDPNLKHSWNNLGLLYKDSGDLVKALETLQRAIALDERYSEALNNIGTVLRLMGRWPEAETYFRKALESTPDDLAATRNLCNLLNNQSRFAESGVLLNNLPAGFLTNPEVALNLCKTKIYTCDWQNLSSHLQTVRSGIIQGKLPNEPFQMLSIWDDPLLHLSVAENYAKKNFPAHNNRGMFQNRPVTKEQKKRIRVAYFSSDFQFHPVAQLLIGLIEHHNKSKFEVLAFSNGPERDDAYRSRLINAFDEFITIKSLSDAEVHAKVREKEVDIAIDLSGYTIGGRTRVFSMRCAPVQINFLGYPGTLGADYYDFIIADPVIIPPESEKFYKEKVLRLKHSYQPNDRSRPSSHPPSKASLGLPAKGFIYCCFNNNYKITQEVFSAWARILSKVEGSVLWLLQDNELATKNLKTQAGDLGVDPSRLVFAARAEFEEYLSRQVHADLFLDTFPYNAHTTASDALWMGVPVLTYQGKSFASRVASSLLKTSGLDELITTSLADYEALAIALGTNTNLLQPLRKKLTQERSQSKLFDIDSYTESFENCLQLATALKHPKAIN